MTATVTRIEFGTWVRVHATVQRVTGHIIERMSDKRLSLTDVWTRDGDSLLYADGYPNPEREWPIIERWPGERVGDIEEPQRPGTFRRACCRLRRRLCAVLQGGRGLRWTAARRCAATQAARRR